MSQTNPLPTKLQTLTELSAESRLSVTQIRRLVKKGLIPFLQPGGPGGKLLFQPNALLAANQSAEALPSPTLPPTAGQQPRWMRDCP